MDFSFLQPNEDATPICRLCSKSFTLLRFKNNCKICAHSFCSSCSHKSSLLRPQFDTKYACKVCAIVFLVPKLDESQINKLPVKLSTAIFQAYGLPKNLIVEKKDLTTILKQKGNFDNYPISNYRNKWNTTKDEVIKWKNLLPQITNALEGNQENGQGSSSNQENLIPEIFSGINRFFSNLTNDIQNLDSPQNSGQRRDQTYGLNTNNSNSSTPKRPNSGNYSRADQSYQQNSNFSNPNTSNTTYSYSSTGPQTTNVNNNTSFSARTNYSTANYTSSSSQANSPTFNSTNSSYANSNTYPTSYSSNARSSYGRAQTQESKPQATAPKPSPPKAAITIEELVLIEEHEKKIGELSVGNLKSILRSNLINFDNILEKSELINKVELLVNSAKKEKKDTEKQNSGLSDHGLNEGFMDDENLCKICFENPINCVLLECGHAISCVDCGKELFKNKNPCPICRSDIAKVVRIFKA